MWQGMYPSRGGGSYDTISSTSFDVDWSTANIQTLSIANSGTYGVNFVTSPTGNAHLTLVVKYTALSPGAMTFTVPNSRGNGLDQVFSPGGTFAYQPTTGTTDVFHFFYRVGPNQYFIFPMMGYR
jgi:hypothetical protein